MPVSSSILWKPLRDPHYVVASLQPGGGGRRQLSIKQTTLSQVQAQARGAFGQIAVGLLLGNRYECPATGMAYVLIESSVDGAPVPDEHWLGPAVSGLLDRLKTRDSLECVGWYCSTPVVGGRLGAVHAAIHTALFRQPWQTTLIVTDSGDSGGLFLNDPLAARWFLSPFFEETEPTRNRQVAKPTCIVWPTYLTTDVIVAPTSPEPAQPEPRLAAPAPRYQPAPRPEIRAEPRPEMRTEPRPVLRPEPRPVLRPEPRPEVRREPRPLFRPEPRPEVRAEPQPEVRAKPQPEVRAEPQPEIRVEPRPEVRVEPSPEVRAEPRPELAPERRQQPWAVPRPQPHVEPRVEFEAEPRAEPPADARTEQRSEPEPQAAPERPARPILAPAALATRQATAAIARASATSLKRATDAGATSLKRAADAGVSASRSGLGHLRDASAAVTDGIVRRAPDVRAAVASLGTSAVKGVSSVAQASVAFVTRAREAAARRHEQAVAQREAAAQARREREAAQRAERAAVEQARREREAAKQAERAAADQARREREAAKQAERAAADQARREAAERAQREAAERAQREAAERAQREAAERAKREAILRARAAPRTEPFVRTPPSNFPVTNEPHARPRTQPAPVQRLAGQLADKQAPLQQPVIATQLADLEDTASSDPPFRYLALAARESFVVISNSEASRADHLEHWVLEEQEAGVLLTVITSDSAVREATLHYNLRTDDDALLERTPPEHRDLESRTIYVREPAIESLRARCRRLRMGGALVREWKVSPPIDLPHPSRIHAGTNGESETRSATETSEPDALRMPPQ